MKKTKIDWADSTWNPVTGCLHGCEYCYARAIANRFGWHANEPDINERILYEIPVFDGKKQPYPFDFAPTFHQYRLGEPAAWTKPRTIFVCSMADLFGDWVPDEWIKQVFEACEAAPQHRFLFLTKNPTRFGRINGGTISTTTSMPRITCGSARRLPVNMSLTVYANCPTEMLIPSCLSSRYWSA